MAEELQLLNSETHGQLRMRADSGEPHPHFVMIVLSEFAAASSTCPIFLAKDPGTGEFYAAALFGFEPGELLVEGAAQGKAPFQPLDVQRRGFFAADENIAIDISHPRFDSRATLPLFEEDGTPSNALRRMQKVIGELAGGVEATRDFVRELLRLKLVEPIDVSLAFDDGTQLSLAGLYTVSKDALGGLSDSDVVALFRSGYLQAALCMSLSLNQVPVLARRRNERLTA